MLTQAPAAKPRLRLTRDECLARFPRLAAAMIVESAGYFTPGAVGNAIAAHIAGMPFHCEWYCHCAGLMAKRIHDEIGAQATTEQFDRYVMDVNESCIRYCATVRRPRKLSEYRRKEFNHALKLVRAEIDGDGRCLLASWF